MPNPNRPEARLPANHYTKFKYRLRVRDEDIAGVRLRIECLDSLESTIDQLFEELTRAGDPGLLEELCPYFGVVWPSARALAEQIACPSATGVALRGASLLEVGCGLALPSIVAARLGARVTASDCHPDVPAFLSRNLALNPEASTIRFEPLDWQKESEAVGRFDWVVGSDILYEKQHPAAVARALLRYRAPGGEILVADPGRPYLQAFVDEMKRLGMDCETLIRTVRDEPTPKDVFVLRFKSRS